MVSLTSVCHGTAHGVESWSYVMLLCHGLESWSYGACVMRPVSFIFIVVSLGLCYGVCVMGSVS